MQSKDLIRKLKRNKPAIVKGWHDAQFDPQLITDFNVQDIPDVNEDWLQQNYVAPLFDLFVEYAKTGRTHFRDVYLDERIRYVPYQSSRHDAFFAKVLSAQEDVVVNALCLSGEARESFRAFWNSMHSHLTDKKNASVRILALGDCLMNEIRVFLSSACAAEHLDLNMRFLYFSASQQAELSTSHVVEFLKNNKVDMIAMSFFTYSGLPFYSILMNQAGSMPWDEATKQINGLIGFVRKFIEGLREVTDVPFLIHNVAGLLINNEGGYLINQARKRLPFLSPVSRGQQDILNLINREMEELALNTPNAFLINEKAVVESKGYRHCIKPLFSRFTFRSALFHTGCFGGYIATEYLAILLSYQKLKKTKVILLDFDNTLWEGVMADGPVRQKKDIQNLLKTLKDAGIVLVAVSKNNPDTIRWGEMILQPSDFVLLKINWNLKVQSIEETADELNLGLDSFVFIDDNPAEREFVIKRLPKVTTLDALDPETWICIRRMLNFPNTSDTDESRKRTEMYRGQAMRKAAMSKDYDYPSMMAMLQLKVVFGPAQKKNLDRIHELVSRTNQFNTTTIRYSKPELQGLLDSGNHAVYIAELSDKFSDLGIVCAAVIKRDNTTAIFESFVMSCRAMGFGLEQLMLRLVIEAEKNSEKFTGRFIPTGRNTPAKDLFSGSGFKPLSPTEWVLDDKNALPQKPSWFAVHSN